MIVIIIIKTIRMKIFKVIKVCRFIIKVKRQRLTSNCLSRFLLENGWASSFRLTFFLAIISSTNGRWLAEAIFKLKIRQFVCFSTIYLHFTNLCFIYFRQKVISNQTWFFEHSCALVTLGAQWRKDWTFKYLQKTKKLTKLKIQPRVSFPCLFSLNWLIK